jgi:menaquinone-dependent protoporphyrinogen oxidase
MVAAAAGGRDRDISMPAATRRILILYSTVDGHTAHICGRLREGIAQRGYEVTLLDLDDNSEVDIVSYRKVLVGASIRYGRHRPNVIDFMRGRRAELEARHCAFFSVNIVARKASRNAPDTNPYIKQFIGQIGWRPALLEVFAGRLDYPRCAFWDRQVIRFIMLLTRGPTDSSTVVEYTDWDRVEAFGRAIADL